MSCLGPAQIQINPILSSLPSTALDTLYETSQLQQPTGSVSQPVIWSRTVCYQL